MVRWVILSAIGTLLCLGCGSSGDGDSGGNAGGDAGMPATGGDSGTSSGGSAAATGGSGAAGGSGGSGGSGALGRFEIVEQSDDALVAIASITGFGPNDVFLSRTPPVLRSGSIEHFDGAAWRPVLETPLGVYAMTTADGSLFASGAGGTMLMFDGTSWYDGDEWLAQTPSDSFTYVEIWAASETDLYIGRDDLGDIYHYDGARWDLQILPTERGLIPTYALFGAATDDVYASIYQEGLFHFDGSAWTKVSHPSAIISGIHGRSASDIWAVGTEVLHYDGSAWTLVSVGDAFVGTGIINRRYHAVWVAPSGKVWIVGEEGVALYGDAGGFELVPTGVTVTLFTVWGSSEHDVWAGGVQETLLHYTVP
jgi:hypothetical protein